MPAGSGLIAVSPAFFGKIFEYSSQSIAIEIAWRSLRLRSRLLGRVALADAPGRAC